MTMALIEICVLLVTLMVIATYTQWKYSYWKKRGVPYIKPRFPFGNIENPLTRKSGFGFWLQKFYNEFKARGEKYAGLYMLTRPILLTVDPELVKIVMLKDFDHFVDRGTYHNEKDDPLSAHLFAIGGKKWRDLRTKLTPTFTSGKMKMMFDTLVKCTEGMEEFLQNKCVNSEPLDIKDVLERFTVDVIGSSAFGIECNSFKSEHAEFWKHGLKVFAAPSILKTMRTLLATSRPNLARSLGITILPKESTRFFMNVVNETVNYRQTNNFRRNDMLQILIDLKNNNQMVLELKEIAAQAFVFFLAGFETSSTTMQFCLYELALNPKMQEKVRAEIKSVLSKHQDKITYDAIMEMKYMQQLIDETLRKYPPVTFLTRECVKDYKIPNTNTTIEKGVLVMIPVFGLHRDPDYYPNPEKFDPERFSADNKRSITPFTYIPFGEGPRICVGMRFGLMETKIGLTTLLKDYKFTLNKGTKTPLVWNKFTFILSPETPILLNVEKID